MIHDYLITYEDAEELVKVYKNYNFYKTQFMIDGYKIVSYSYFLCTPNMFKNPLTQFPHVHAMDMRGVTFVFNEDGTLFKRYLMLRKFFNVNQTEETQLHLLENKEIKSITTKEDGTLIAFMGLPNGKVFAKTIMGFNNDQVITAMTLYNSDIKLKTFIDNIVFNEDCTSLFEYVSYKNRIVLVYNNDELIYIGKRYTNGKYVSAANENLENANIKYVKSIINNSLNELIEFCKNEKDIEGVVVEFSDGEMVKVKTNWYFENHRLRTENIFREDYVIEMYLKGTLDDVLQTIPNDKDNADIYKFVNNVIQGVENWSMHIENYVNQLYEPYNNIENFSIFCHTYKNAPFFGLFIEKVKRGEDSYRTKKVEYMLHHTRTLKMARNIITKWK